MAIFAPYMRKTFVSNLILLLLLNLVVKPFFILGIEAEIQNRVGAEVFGSYFALINFSFIMNVLLDMGITNWNTRNIAQNPGSVSTQLPPLLLLRGWLTLGYLLLVIAFGVLFQYEAHQLWMLALLALNQVLASLILFLRSYLTGLHLFRYDSVISILDRLLLAVLMSALLWFFYDEGPFQIEWLIYGQTASYIATAIFAFLFIPKKNQRLEWKFDGVFSREILKQSFPYALLFFISIITYRIDSVMLERMAGPEEAGIYAMGYRFFEAFNMIAYLFSVLLLPIYARMISKGEDVNPLTTLSFKILFVGVWMVAIVGFIWRFEVMEVFYTSHLDEASAAFGMLMIGCVSFSLQYIFGTLLTANGNLTLLIRFALVSMLTNIAFNFILIPHYGAFGSAAANGIAQTLFLSLEIIAVRSKFRFGSWKFILQLFAFMGITLAWGWKNYELYIINQGSFAYYVARFLAGALITALVTKMLDFKRFLKLLKMRSGESEA